MDGFPVWLLDIDGVLNAINTEPDTRVWPAAVWLRAEAPCEGAAWPLLAARPVLDFIREAHENSRVEIRWHTTWQVDAAGVGRALGLPVFPIQSCPEFTSYREQRVGGAAPTGARWWKLAAAERVLGAEDRPLVWTDDDIDSQLCRIGYQHPIMRIPSALTVCPRTSGGLTPRHLRTIDAFLDEAARHRAAASEHSSARAGDASARPGRRRLPRQRRYSAAADGSGSVVGSTPELPPVSVTGGGVCSLSGVAEPAGDSDGTGAGGDAVAVGAAEESVRMGVGDGSVEGRTTLGIPSDSGLFCGTYSDPGSSEPSSTSVGASSGRPAPSVATGLGADDPDVSDTPASH